MKINKIWTEEEKKKRSSAETIIIYDGNRLINISMKNRLNQRHTRQIQSQLDYAFWIVIYKLKYDFPKM